jgi:AcrR family transcriptional regulator
MLNELSPSAAAKSSGRLAAVARPRDQVKRRRELVAATSRLVARKGLANVKLRDVADAAGVTSGAVLYYYDGLDELFTAAYDRGVERFCAEREEAVAALDDPLERLALAIHLGVPESPDDSEIRILYELESVAFRDAACAALMAAYVERQVAMYTGILEAGAATGAFRLAGDARTVARNIIALEDGQGLYVLMDRDAPEDVERRILAYAATATGVAAERLTRRTGARGPGS